MTWSPGACWPSIGAVPSSSAPKTTRSPEEQARIDAMFQMLADAKRERLRVEVKQREQEQLRQNGIDDELQAFEDKICRLITPGSGAGFKDTPDAPEMVIVPRGTLMAKTRTGGLRGSRLYSKYKLETDLAVSRYAISFDEWDAAEGVEFRLRPSDSGWGRGRRPVINVSWNDAQRYVKWLSKRTGRAYRLLNEDEWEYACRAGTLTPFWWGRFLTRRHANFKGNVWQVLYNHLAKRRKTVPVDAFAPNPWGLHQMHGNVWEWCGDKRCHGVRGGSFASSARDLLDDTRWKRSNYPPWGVIYGNSQTNAIGFRVCREVGKVIRTRVRLHATPHYPEPILGLGARQPAPQEIAPTDE
jgi:formylglycine-generating enzyme required for sulfatase activity